jgi:uncharacterized protein (TIGR03067 family)
MGLNRDFRVEFSRHGLTSWWPKGKRAASGEVQYGYALDPTARPKRIDLANVTEPPMNSVHGVYDVDGNRLTICWAAPGAGLPPSKLAPGPGATIFVLKRMNEAPEKTPRQQISPAKPIKEARPK